MKNRKEKISVIFKALEKTDKVDKYLEKHGKLPNKYLGLFRLYDLTKEADKKIFDYEISFVTDKELDKIFNFLNREIKWEYIDRNNDNEDGDLKEVDCGPSYQTEITSFKELKKEVTDYIHSWEESYFGPLEKDTSVFQIHTEQEGFLRITTGECESDGEYGTICQLDLDFYADQKILNKIKKHFIP